MIKGERKFQTPFYFVNRAKFIFSANQLPQVDDVSLAFWRRWIVVEFPNSFKGREDFNLEDKLKSELSGILNFALDGYYRLTANNRFTTAVKAEQVKEQWQKEADSIYHFISEKIETKLDSWIAKENLYLA